MLVLEEEHINNSGDRSHLKKRNLKLKVMGHFNDLPKCDINMFERMISMRINNPGPIFVVCNDIRTILKTSQVVSDNLKTHDVYYQTNSFFFGDMKTTEFITTEYRKQAFEDYCNYFDRHRQTLITRMNKSLFNYSKNSGLITLAEYPEDIKMILIIENFNFWDLNSQSIMAQLTEKNPNIIVIGQLRSDFDFAINHIDIGIRTGNGGGRFCRLEE